MYSWEQLDPIFAHLEKNENDMLMELLKLN